MVPTTKHDQKDWTNDFAEKGLKLFEEITYLDEYYLTNAEIDALTRHANALVEHIPAGARIVELGSGCVISRSPHLPPL